MPMVSIVTINWNNAKGLRTTLESVQAQTEKLFEYLIIDGNSSDGSKDLLRQYDGIIDCAISEPDKGIYDAMIKGAQKATGEWIWFLNSGDTLSSPAAAAEMLATLQKGVDIFYADYLVRYSDGYLAPRSAHVFSRESIWRGMPTSHQACLISRSAILHFGFDKAHGFAGDFGQVFRILNAGGSAVRVSNCPVIVEAGGVSDQKRIKSTIIHAKIVFEKFRSAPVMLYWSLKKVDQLARVAVKKLLPEFIVRWFHQHVKQSDSF